MWPGRGESRGQPPDNDDNDGDDNDDNDDNDNEMMIFGGLSLQILEVLIHGGETVLTCPDHIIILFHDIMLFLY